MISNFSLKEAAHGYLQVGTTLLNRRTCQSLTLFPAKLKVKRYFADSIRDSSMSNITWEKKSNREHTANI